MLQRSGPGIAPGEQGVVGRGDRRFPLFGVRQTLARPLGIRHGILGGHARHGMIGILAGKRAARAVPPRRARTAGRLHKRQVLGVGHRVTVDPEGRQGHFVPRQIVAEPRGMAVVALGQFLPLGLAGAHDDPPRGDQEHAVLVFGKRIAELPVQQDDEPGQGGGK